MELVLGLLGFALAIGLPIGAIMGILAWSRGKQLAKQVALLEQQIRHLRLQLLPLLPSGDASKAGREAAVQKAASPAPSSVMAPTATAVDPGEPLPLPMPLSLSLSLPTTPEPVASPAAPIMATPAVAPFEAIIGKRWLTWAGVALVFFSGVFLLKYAYDQEWLGHLLTPPIRIAGLALAAGAMLAVGLRFMRQGLEALGQGLAGGGIAIAYLAVYGGFSPSVMLTPQPLFPGQLAFALMMLVTVVGMTLAVRADARALAVCAVLGGFATPALIDTGNGSRETLFAYLLILDVGVLAVALFRRWRLLDVVAFAGTVVLYAGWHHGRESAHAAPWAMLAWLQVFHLVFVTLPFLHHWRNRSAVTIERFGLAIANLAFTLAYAAVLLVDEHQQALAVVCLSLAGLYAAIGVFTRMRIAEDRKVGHGFLALGTMDRTAAPGGGGDHRFFPVPHQ